MCTLTPLLPPTTAIQCLSPDFSTVGIRPLPRVANVSSTTISLEWDEPTLPGFCDSVTFSFPPLTYVPHVVFNPPMAGDPVVSVLSLCEVHVVTFLTVQGWTHETQFTVENLKPFFQYQIQMATFNVFTTRRNSFDTRLSLDVNVETTEGGRTDHPPTHTHTHTGLHTNTRACIHKHMHTDTHTHTYTHAHTHTVPDPPMGLNFIVLGTATVQLIWMQGEPRADPDDVTYYIFTGAGHVTETMGIRTNVTINSTNGIVPGSTQTIQVWALVVQVTVWKFESVVFRGQITSALM